MTPPASCPSSPCSSIFPSPSPLRPRDPLSFRSLLTLAGPGALAVLPAAAWLAMAPDSPALAQAARGYPYAALAVVALLAWRFQRSRMVAAALALALAGALPGGAATAWLGIALLPLSFAVVAATADRRVGAPRGLLQLACAPMAAGAAAMAVRTDAARVQAWLGRPLVDALPASWAGTPQIVLLAAFAGLAALAGLALRRGRATEAGLFWSALAGTVAIATPEASPARGAWLLAAAVALGVALVEAAYALAFRDELTDLPGRRALGSLLSTLRPPYAIAVVDVDHFKKFNDRYGHDVGDQVLRMVAARLAAVGGGGRAFRSGGEEFTLVFPGRTADEATPHLEAVRRAVADSPFVLRRTLRPATPKGAAKRGKSATPKRHLRVTISIGVAAGGGRAATAQQVVTAADKAMYRAKQGGRNRVAA